MERLPGRRGGQQRHAVRALLTRLAGAGLVAVVLWTVPWRDRVIDRGGVEHRGRIVGGAGDAVLLRTDAGTARIEVARAADAQPGLLSTLANLADQPLWALLGLALHSCSVLTTIVRWALMLAGAGLRAPLAAVLRLGWIAAFFTALLPGGIASGDVVKSLFISRLHPAHKARAVVTVVADRVVGMFVLCLIAATGLLALPDASNLGLARPILISLPLLGLLALALLLWPGLRRRTGFTRLLDRLPFPGVMREIRGAGALYGSVPRPLIHAALVALASHGLVLCAFYCYGRALGMALPLIAIASAIPIAQMLSAIPGLPGGWGVGDFAFLALLPPVGVPAGAAVALSFTYRILHTAIALPGGLLLARARAGGETGEQNGEAASCPSS